MKTERLAYVAASGRIVGEGLGRVVTKANKLHRGQWRAVRFEIDRATATDDKLVLD